MGALKLYDADCLAEQAEDQKLRAWDLDRDIDWSLGIDLAKPLVPLDNLALMCPGASQDERLAISQLMGLIIAASTCEMEETLTRDRNSYFDSLLKRWPVSPEFLSLGEQFFAEEKKHSQAFRRYLGQFAEAADLDLFLLLDLLPRVQGTTYASLLRKNAISGGLVFWWCVATVEQEFLAVFRELGRHKKALDPLYFDLHLKHTEEEARHIDFPFLMLELLIGRQEGVRAQLFRKLDLAAAQLMLMSWSGQMLLKLQKIKKLSKTHRHPFFHALASALELMAGQSTLKTAWYMLTRAPYISSLVNPTSHGKVLAKAKSMASLSVPFAANTPEKTL